MIPLLGLGTYNLQGAECTQTVKQALRLGYRHIDTAAVYENHAAIGQGIRGFDRSQLFLTTKVLLDSIDLEDLERSIEKACDTALHELATNYIDLYLIHWPQPLPHLISAFRTIEKLVAQGKVRHAGVSNYTIHHLEDLACEHYVPFANQVEFHPYLYQKQLFDYCLRHQIQLIAYRPFGKGKLLEDPVLKGIGEQMGKTAAQVALRWLIERKIAVIPKASSERHLRENFEALSFKLSPEAMDKIDQLHQNKRFCKADSPIFTY